MTPPGSNEVSTTWHRHFKTKSKTMLGIPSSDLVGRVEDDRGAAALEQGLPREGQAREP